MANSVVLSQNSLRSRPFVAKFKVADDVWLIALIDLVTIAEVVIDGQFVIDTSEVVREVVWIRQRQPHRSYLNRNAVDVRCRYVVVVANLGVNLR